MGQTKKFTDLLLVEPTRAYLQVGILVSLAVEKAEQGRLFDLLSLILSEKMMESANVREKWMLFLRLRRCGRQT